jgi:hypothetical protein
MKYTTLWAGLPGMHLTAPDGESVISRIYFQNIPKSI